MLHANLSPSSAKRWTSCTASPAAQMPYPHTTSEHSRPGTCGHQMGAECLESGGDAAAYFGRVMEFWRNDTGRLGESWVDQTPAGVVVQHTHTVDRELVEMVQVYVNFVRNLRDTLGAQMIVERQVPIGHVTGEEGATGTSDCILITEDEIVCIDLKLGRSPVKAYDVIEPETYDLLTGEPVPPKLRTNLQAALYIAGSLEEYGVYGDFKRCRAIIVQPALKTVSEYGCELDELYALLDWLRERAEATRKNPEFVPSADNCFFCRAKYDCHVRNKAALESALDGFDDLPTATVKPITLYKLGDLLDKVEMLRKWCDDVESKAMSELLAGKKVVRSDGTKFVLKKGRSKNKEWDDPNTVEQLLKSWRVREVDLYVKKLISPSQAEKIAETTKGKHRDKTLPKPTIGKQHWKQLQEHIKQEDGAPVMALETDPRPRWLRKESGFEDVTENPSDDFDLF
jgi:hypothetical protein